MDGKVVKSLPKAFVSSLAFVLEVADEDADDDADEDADDDDSSDTDDSPWAASSPPTASAASAVPTKIVGVPTKVVGTFPQEPTGSTDEYETDDYFFFSGTAEL